MKITKLTEVSFIIMGQTFPLQSMQTSVIFTESCLSPVTPVTILRSGDPNPWKQHVNKKNKQTKQLCMYILSDFNRFHIYIFEYLHFRNYQFLPTWPPVFFTLYTVKHKTNNTVPCMFSIVWGATSCQASLWVALSWGVTGHLVLICTLCSKTHS